LLRAQLRNVIAEKLLVFLLRFLRWIDFGRPFLKIDLVSFSHSKVFCLDFHGHPFPGELRAR